MCKRTYLFITVLIIIVLIIVFGYSVFYKSRTVATSVSDNKQSAPAINGDKSAVQQDSRPGTPNDPPKPSEVDKK